MFKSIFSFAQKNISLAIKKKICRVHFKKILMHTRQKKKKKNISDKNF